MIILLTALAATVWVNVLNRPDPTAGGCLVTAAAVAPAGSATGTAGRRLPAAGLDEVPPAPPQEVAVRVLNANGERGQAGIVAHKLAALGFARAAEPANDPLHPGFDLRCHGEIRFGPAGRATARTLSLAVPCAELVGDDRHGPVVDLALGTEFTGVRPNAAARKALHDLSRIGEALLPMQGGQAAGAVAAAVDPELLRAARQTEC